MRNLQDATLSAIRALFDFAVLEQNQSLYYKELGYRDYDPEKVDEQGNSWSGPGKGILTVEGRPYGDNTLYRGYPVQVNLKKYTSELKVTEEDLHWIRKALSANKIQEVKDFTADAINALNYNVNEDACKMFYLGFGTTFFTGGDGLSLYNTAHTIRANSSTYNNTFPVGDKHRPFGAQALIDAVNIMDRFPSHNGVEMRRCKRLRVLCSKESAPVVWQTLKSLYGPLNNNMGLSSASMEAFQSRGVNIDYYVMEDLPYAYKDYWFIVDLDRAQKMLLCDWGWKPRLNDTWEYRKGVHYNDGSVYFGLRALSFQFTFGSIGSNATIS